MPKRQEEEAEFTAVIEQLGRALFDTIRIAHSPKPIYSQVKPQYTELAERLIRFARKED